MHFGHFRLLELHAQNEQLCLLVGISKYQYLGKLRIFSLPTTINNLTFSSTAVQSLFAGVRVALFYFSRNDLYYIYLKS